MSSRIFQNVIIQMRDALDRPVGVIDDQGFVVASSELAIIGSRLDDFLWPPPAEGPSSSPLPRARIRPQG